MKYVGKNNFFSEMADQFWNQIFCLNFESYFFHRKHFKLQYFQFFHAFYDTLINLDFWHNTLYLYILTSV